MRLLLLISVLTLTLSSSVSAQWKIFPNAPSIMNGFRFDDVYFTSRQHGSFITQEGFIHTTFDGGESWISSPRFNVYLRAIEYLNEDIGFAGSLEGRFFKTLDGGRTWEDVTDALPGDETIVCGLGHFGDKHVYGVGNFAGPAVFYRSSDAGETWERQSLDSLLFAAIDVHFVSEMEGYICGSGPDTGSLIFEGIILRTLDGGDSWHLLMRTGQPYTYVWKMDFLDNGYMFGALETFMGDRPALIRSRDWGANWDIVDLPHNPMLPFDGQGIGFLNNDLGWFAGYGFGLFETRDGGETWERKFATQNINRFFKVDSSMMLGSGFNLFVFEELSTTVHESLPEMTSIRPHEILSVTPNPASTRLQLSYRLDRPTLVLMDLCKVDGTYAKHISKTRQDSGLHQIELDITDLPPGMYHVTLRTHERHLSQAFVKVE